MQITAAELSSQNKISILIPTWNNISLLKLCVASIKKNSRYQHQIIIHVNQGSDGTLAWVRDEGLTHTWSDVNIGICLAVNQAAALADHDLILYMNDDMYCCPDWDAKLIEKIAMFGHDAFMLSGTMIEPIDSGNPCVSVGDFGRDAESFDESRLLENYKSLSKADWYGSTWPPTLVHKRWWHAVGGYSIEFSPGMSSDNDFTMKMWAAGCRIFLGVGDSLVYHFMCKSTGRIIKNDGRRQFMRKWGISSSFFDKYFLRRGVASKNIKLIDPDANFRFRFKLWINKKKALLSLTKKNLLF